LKKVFDLHLRRLDMETTFKRQTVTRQNILDAIHDFSSQYPNPATYDNWLQKATYKYAVHYGERVYPPKHILSRATGIPTTDFSGGEQTNRVLQQLGFDIACK